MILATTYLVIPFVTPFALYISNRVYLWLFPLNRNVVESCIPLVQGMGLICVPLAALEGYDAGAGALHIFMFCLAPITFYLTVKPVTELSLKHHKV